LSVPQRQWPPWAGATPGYGVWGRGGTSGGSTGRCPNVNGPIGSDTTPVYGTRGGGGQSASVMRICSRVPRDTYSLILSGGEFPRLARLRQMGLGISTQDQIERIPPSHTGTAGIPRHRPLSATSWLPESALYKQTELLPLPQSIEPPPGDTATHGGGMRHP